MKLQLQLLITVIVFSVAMGTTFTADEIAWMIVDNLRAIGIALLSLALLSSFFHKLLPALLNTVLIVSTIYLLIFKIDLVLCWTLIVCTVVWG